MNSGADPATGSWLTSTPSFPASRAPADHRSSSVDTRPHVETGGRGAPSPAAWPIAVSNLLQTRPGVPFGGLARSGIRPARGCDSRPRRHDEDVVPRKPLGLFSDIAPSRSFGFGHPTIPTARGCPRPRDRVDDRLERVLRVHCGEDGDERLDGDARQQLRRDVGDPDTDPGGLPILVRRDPVPDDLLRPLVRRLGPEVDVDRLRVPDEGTVVMNRVL